MSETRHATIWCYACGEWFRESGLILSVRRSATTAGWKRARRKGHMIDVCPSCYMDPDGMDRTDSWS